MNNKSELKKQLIVLSLILILVIIVAIMLNIKTDNSKTNNTNSVNTNIVKNNETEEQKLLNNLKGLLEDTNNEDYIQDETQGTQENKIMTESGETIIIRE